MSIEAFYTKTYNVWLPQYDDDLQGGETLTYTGSPQFSITGHIRVNRQGLVEDGARSASRIDADFYSERNRNMKRGARVGNETITWVPPTSWADGSWWANDMWEVEATELEYDRFGDVHHQVTKLFQEDYSL